MQVFPQTGEAGITVQYSGDILDSAVSIHTDLLQPPTQFYVMFTGGTANLVKNVKLTGQTSAATMVVKSVVVTSGTLAGNDGAGIIFIEQISGTITLGENLRVATTTYCVARSTQIDCGAMNLPAKSIFLVVETNTLRFLYSGQIPTNSAATPASFGTPIAGGQNIEIVGLSNAKKFQMINAVSTSNGVANITIKY